MRCLTGPSFRWAALLFDVLFDTVEALLIPMEELCYLRQASSYYGEAVLLATAFFCSLRYRDRDKPNIDIKSTMALCSSTLLRVAFRASSLWSIDSFWMPTASAVRHYTETQSLTLTAVFPSLLSAILLCFLLRLCSGDRSEIDSTLTLLVNRLYDSSFDRIPLSMSTQCSLIQSVYGAPAQSIAGSILLYYFLLLLLLSCTINCEQLATNR